MANISRNGQPIGVGGIERAYLYTTGHLPGQIPTTKGEGGPSNIAFNDDADRIFPYPFASGRRLCEMGIEKPAPDIWDWLGSDGPVAPPANNRTVTFEDVQPTMPNIITNNPYAQSPYAGRITSEDVDGQSGAMCSVSDWVGRNGLIAAGLLAAAFLLVAKGGNKVL